MKTRIYVTNIEFNDIYPTGYFLKAEEAEDQMEYDYNHLTNRERKTHTLFAAAYEVEHEEPVTAKNIERIFSDWNLEQCWLPDPVDYIEWKEK